MSSNKQAPEALSYFMHDVDGRLYGAWFRPRSNHHVEVIVSGRIKSAPCGQVSIERAAVRLLEEIVRTLGLPVRKL
jgi:hypothetical protein